MKNGCTVRLKELENSSPIAGVTTVKVATSYFSRKHLGFRKAVPARISARLSACFLLPRALFFVLTRNGAKRENRNKT